MVLMMLIIFTFCHGANCHSPATTRPSLSGRQQTTTRNGLRSRNLTYYWPITNVSVRAQLELYFEMLAIDVCLNPRPIDDDEDDNDDDDDDEDYYYSQLECHGSIRFEKNNDDDGLEEAADTKTFENDVSYDNSNCTDGIHTYTVVIGTFRRLNKTSSFNSSSELCSFGAIRFQVIGVTLWDSEDHRPKWSARQDRPPSIWEKITGWTHKPLEELKKGFGRIWSQVRLGIIGFVAACISLCIIYQCCKLLIVKRLCCKH